MLLMEVATPGLYQLRREECARVLEILGKREAFN